ncbi:FapA family protein [Salidesulfovibrio brasiliensis]
MPFFLKHYFDPDFDYMKLRPTQNEDGSVDHYELNYVQNVVEGQVIAEWAEVAEEDIAEYDQRFLFEEKKFPAGRGTGLKRNDPDKLFAATNGYVLYQEDRITVKETLNVRRDVDYNTGNVTFVGKLNVYGSVRAGFNIQAREIDIQGQVEGASVHAFKELSCRGGVKGQGKALLEAGANMRLSFAEFATLKCKGNLLVRGSLMHSKVFCGERLAVGGRMQGADVYCHKYVYVGEKLGGGLDADMTILLGYHPIMLYADNQLHEELRRLRRELEHSENQREKGGFLAKKHGPKIEQLREEIEMYRSKRARLWEGIRRTEKLHECKVLVPGSVRSGVEISIGPAYYKVREDMNDVYFYYEDGEVKVGDSAAIK